jgi:hypothetical protein
MIVRRLACKFNISKSRNLINLFLPSISGVGVRKYYANLGYYLDGPYMSKILEPMENEEESM